MKYLFATTAALAVAGPLHAQDVMVTPLADVRLRHEHIEQDGIALNADAVTLRVRTGAKVESGPWSVLAEAQATLALVDRYDDGLRGPITRPQVGDPENIALYRAQVQYHTRAATLTAGRQRIAIDDERFIGNAAWRQAARTFDAVRAEVTTIPGLKLDMTYAWSARTTWGIDGAGARQQAVSGDNVFLNAAYATPVGTVTGFGYLIDQDEAAVQGFRLSSQTYGARLSGTRALSPAAKLSYLLGYARQSDWHRNPNDYAANYYVADATLAVGGWALNAGYEVLGADRGTALTSFQTPLGAVFKFQGWADKLTTTPPNGVHDLYAGSSYGWKKVLGADAIGVSGAFHRFRSDRLDQRYGDEIDLLASVKLRHTTVSARYAHYEADSFATDTDKLWFQLDWIY